MKNIIKITLIIVCWFPLFLFAQNEKIASDTLDNKYASKNFLEQQVSVPFSEPLLRKQSVISSATVKGEDLRSLYTPNLGNTLSGKLAGLHVVQKGGSPGNTDAPDLMIRGRQTFQDNSILVLVDGIETKWSNLLIDEIESVTLLKDAPALALYGQRGANGILHIKTKRGEKSDKIKVAFSSRFGLQKAAQLPSLLNNGEYAELYNQAMISDGKDIANGYFKNQDIVGYFKNGTYPHLYADVNWYDEVLKDGAFAHEYSATFSGGNDFVKYHTALGYMNTQGLYGHTNGTTNSNYDLKRYNIRTNVDIKLLDWLRSEVSFRAVIDDKKFPNADENTIWKTMAVFLPYAVRTPSGAWGGTEQFPENPAAAIQQKGYKSINERTLDASVKLIVNLDVITKGLEGYARINLSNNYFMYNNKTRSFAYEELIPRPDLIVPGETPEGEMPYDVVARGSDGSFEHKQESGTQWNRTTIMAGLNYGQTFDEHTVKSSFDFFRELYKAQGNQPAFAKQNFLAHINYSYQDKYLADLAMSVSGSENFPKGERYGFFPALGLGWIISKEDFMPRSQILTFFKLKGSMGLTGNDRVGSTSRFIYEQTYVGAGNYLIGENLSQGQSTFKEGMLANPFVTWEKALKANIGFEATLFNKLSFSAEYFHEKRTDIFVQPGNYISGLIGADIHNMNEGKAKNSGFELELFYNEKIGDVSFYAGTRFSFAKNKISDMKEPPRPDNEHYLYAKGRSINQPFVLEAIGFFKDEEDIFNSPVQMFGAVQSGDIKYKDQNGDGFIDDNDRIPVGHTAYPEFYYGLDFGVDYKGFDLGISMQGAGNRTISLLDNNSIIPFLNGGVKPSEWVKNNYWTPERSETAAFPRLTTEDNSNNYRPSTLWQRSGDYLRVKNIELGYTFPSSFTKRLKMEKIRFFVSLVNPFTWDKIDELDIDPEVMNMFTYPVTKSYNAGFSVHF